MDQEVKKTRPKTQLTWSADEARRFLSYVASQRLYPLYRLALHTGMRAGEILGLRWADISWGRRTISISQTLVFTPAGRPMAKNHCTWRIVTISQTMLAVLMEHRRRQLEELMETGAKPGLVFLSATGSPIHPRRLERHFYDLPKRAGVPLIPFHGLRRTYAELVAVSGTEGGEPSDGELLD